MGHKKNDENMIAKELFQMYYAHAQVHNQLSLITHRMLCHHFIENFNTLLKLT